MESKIIILKIIRIIFITLGVCSLLYPFVMPNITKVKENWDTIPSMIFPGSEFDLQLFDGYQGEIRILSIETGDINNIRKDSIKDIMECVTVYTPKNQGGRRIGVVTGNDYGPGTVFSRQWIDFKLKKDTTLFGKEIFVKMLIGNKENHSMSFYVSSSEKNEIANYKLLTASRFLIPIIGGAIFFYIGIVATGLLLMKYEKNIRRQ